MRRVSILLVVVAVLIGVFQMSLWMGSQRFQDVTASEVLDRFNNGETMRIVDVRQPSEYAAGHIPGALLIPLDQLDQRLSELDKESEIFLVCRSGVRSRSAAQMLVKAGFRQVRNISDGMLSWRGSIE